VVVFAAVAIVSLARLAVAPYDSGHGGRAGALAHSTMAAGMAAMTLPAADPVPQWVWLVTFASVAGWFAGQLLRLGPASGPAGLAMGRHAWRRSAGPAAHHLAGSLLMLAAIAVGHGAVPIRTRYPFDGTGRRGPPCPRVTGAGLGIRDQVG